MKDNYRIVRGQNLNHLEDLVNQGVEEGWVPAGGPFYNGGWFQAVVKPAIELNHEHFIVFVGKEECGCVMAATAIMQHTNPDDLRELLNEWVEDGLLITNIGHRRAILPWTCAAHTPAESSPPPESSSAIASTSEPERAEPQEPNAGGIA